MMYFGGGDAEFFSYQPHSFYYLFANFIPKKTKVKNFEIFYEVI